MPHDDPQPRHADAIVAAVDTLGRLLSQLQPLVRPASDWLTVDEVAGEMKCSRDTVTRLIEAGRLPAKNLGQGKHANYRVQRGDLDELNVPPPAKPHRVVRRRTKPTYRRLA